MLNTKYRPKEFKDVLGQKTTIEILENIIKNEDFRPLLFIGNSGVGKTTVAKIFASKIDAEVYELDAATNGGVNDVKNIIQESKLQSLTSKYKVFLIDECHCLSNAAWSSFLLELEMEKKNVLYIFLTTEANKVPETILSRLVTFQFHNLSAKVILEFLKEVAIKENIQIDEESLIYLSVMARGNTRLALNYLEKCQMLNRPLVLADALEIIKVKGNKYILDFIKGDVHYKLKCVESLLEEGYDLEMFIGQCLNLLIKQSLKENKFNPLIDTYLNLKAELKGEQYQKEIIIGRLW